MGSDRPIVCDFLRGCGLYFVEFCSVNDRVSCATRVRQGRALSEVASNRMRCYYWCAPVWAVLCL